MQMTLNNKSQDIQWSRFNSSFLIEVKRGSEIFTSTAVAISETTLITAAHCVDCADTVNIILGDDYTRPHISIKAHEWIVHPGYNPKKSFFENDLAIINLSENLPEYIFFEHLDHNLSLETNSLLERIGFGGRDNQNIKIWTNPTYKTLTFNKKNLILEDSSSVIGDSGGPIYTQKDGVLKLIGIHSTLEGTNKTYVVNIESYLEWIEANLENIPNVV